MAEQLLLLLVVSTIISCGQCHDHYFGATASLPDSNINNNRRNGPLYYPTNPRFPSRTGSNFQQSLFQAMCSSLKPPFNGYVSISGQYHGAIAQYACQNGYQLTPAAVRYCLFGSWTGSDPICKPAIMPMRVPQQQPVLRVLPVISSQQTDDTRVPLQTLDTRVSPQRIPVRVPQRFDARVPPQTDDEDDEEDDNDRVPQQTDPRVPQQPPVVPARLCSALLPPQNGFLTTILRDDNFTALYRCFPGYTLHPPMNEMRYCLQYDGQWSGVTPYCKKDPVKCSDPGIPMNGACQLNSTMEGGVLSCRCCDMCQLVGSSVRMCMSNGNWSGVQPTCIQNVECPTLENTTNGRVTYTSVAAGAVATYWCDDDYQVIGSTVRICQATGQWSGTTPQCRMKEITCEMPHHPENGYVFVNNKTVNGSTAVYKCKTGYSLEGMSRRMCQSNGEWSGSVPECQEIVIIEIKDCGELADPENGKVFYGQTTVSAVALYRCNRGYRLKGQMKRVCEDNYQWSDSAPTCHNMMGFAPRRFSCPRLSSPENGDVIVSGVIIGSKAKYTCRSNQYHLVGNDNRTCQRNGEWSGAEPRCVMARREGYIDPEDTREVVNGFNDDNEDIYSSSDDYDADEELQ